MHRVLKSPNELGYSLLEALFHLLLMGIFLHFVILIFYWKLPIERQLEDYYATEWELFAIELQALLADVEDFHVLMGDRAISFTNDRGKVEIGQNNFVIRKLVNTKGYIPLYTNVSTVIFKHEGHELKVFVTMLDGTKRERRFAIGIREE
ncbi:ComGF family competence protein [Sporosarcina sp. ACRSL]|uniref:ComGF family competence protein n=1 Tax=Sporosarcina sp. ACRSL TaxID=2918215 RepID=UPI001EF58CC4|nr:ComGF family competence protein [Sporosarcina sp. ACRSL]MCG7345146.1 ComGF family competence protein [Sporosarcina sp. ACRSL]